MSDLVLVLIVVPLCSGFLSAQGGRLKRDEIWSRFSCLFEHDLFGTASHFSGSCTSKPRWGLAMISAIECREAASAFKAEARIAGTAAKKVTLLTNIAHTLSGLANQLEMLDSHEHEHKQN